MYLALYSMWGFFTKNKSTVLHEKTVFLSFHNPTCPLVNLCPGPPATMASRPLIPGEYLTEANQQLSGQFGRLIHRIPRVRFLKRLLAHLVFLMIRISPSGLCVTSSALVAGD